MKNIVCSRKKFIRTKIWACFFSFLDLKKKKNSDLKKKKNKLRFGTHRHAQIWNKNKKLIQILNVASTFSTFVEEFFIVELNAWRKPSRLPCLRRWQGRGWGRHHRNSRSWVTHPVSKIITLWYMSVLSAFHAPIPR